MCTAEEADDNSLNCHMRLRHTEMTEDVIMSTLS